MAQVAHRGVEVALPVRDELQVARTSASRRPHGPTSRMCASGSAASSGEWVAQSTCAPPPPGRAGCRPGRPGPRTTARPRARRGSRDRGSRTGCSSTARNDSPWLISWKCGSRRSPGVLLQVGVEAVHGLGPQEEPPPRGARRRARAGSSRCSGDSEAVRGVPARCAVPPSGESPNAIATASTIVDLPLPFSPTSSVTPAGRSSPRRAAADGRDGRRPLVTIGGHMLVGTTRRTMRRSASATGAHSSSGSSRRASQVASRSTAISNSGMGVGELLEPVGQPGQGDLLVTPALLELLDARGR